MTDAWRRTTLCIVMRIVGAFEFLLSFLYIHYISFPEKQQAGPHARVLFLLMQCCFKYQHVYRCSPRHPPHDVSALAVPSST
jgi:hypothetical protein